MSLGFESFSSVLVMGQGFPPPSSTWRTLFLKVGESSQADRPPGMAVTRQTFNAVRQLVASVCSLDE